MLKSLIGARVKAVHVTVFPHICLQAAAVRRVSIKVKAMIQDITQAESNDGVARTIMDVAWDRSKVWCLMLA